MLVLTRKKDQALLIGDDIEITVLDIQGDGIRIGINAPKSVKVFRKELIAEIHQENVNAAKSLTRVQPADLSGLLKLPAAPASKGAGDAKSAAPDAAVPPE